MGILIVLPGKRCPIVSAALPFLTFSITAPYRPLGKSFPPITLRPRIDAPEVGPPPRLSLRLLANLYFQIIIVLPGKRCPIVSAALPFLTFSITAPYRPLGKSFPPITLRPRIDAPEVGPPPRLSLRLLWRTMCPTRRVPSAFGTHDTGC